MEPRRTCSESDSRAFVLKLTAKGEETIARAQARPIPINRRIEDEFGADALREFTAKLNRLIDLCDEEQMAEVEE